MKKTFTALALFLTMVMLLPLLTACKFNLFGKSSQTEEGTETETEVETEVVREGPYLVINGVDVSEFKILKEYDEFEDVYQAVGDAIYDFCGERLKITENDDYPHLIRIVEDYSLLPNEYCVRVSEGELRLGVFCSSFVDGVDLAQTMLSQL